jgi:hypothetical protein
MLGMVFTFDEGYYIHSVDNDPDKIIVSVVLASPAFSGLEPVLDIKPAKKAFNISKYKSPKDSGFVYIARLDISRENLWGQNKAPRIVEVSHILDKLFCEYAPQYERSINEYMKNNQRDFHKSMEAAGVTWDGFLDDEKGIECYHKIAKLMTPQMPPLTKIEGIGEILDKMEISPDSVSLFCTPSARKM